VVAVLAVAAVGSWWVQRAQKVSWAREEALPAIQEILDANASDSSVGNWKAKGRSLKLRPFLFERSGV
jgi:hypothetical protein